MSRYPVPWEIVSVCADYLVVDAVLRNQSPKAKFPANREKNREFYKNERVEPIFWSK